MSRVVQRSPPVCAVHVCVCASEYVVWLCAHVRRPAGVSAVEECETDGERSLTDGGIVPITQFMLECCTEREKKGRGGGGTYVFGRPCAEHMLVLTVEIGRISQNKPVDGGAGLARLGSAPYITK